MDEGLKYKTRPEWPLSSMRLWLTLKTKMGYGLEDVRALLMRALVPSPMLLDGKLETTIDLANQLAGVTDAMYDRCSNLNTPEFQKWREETLSRREAVGLRTVQPRDLWSR